MAASPRSRAKTAVPDQARLLPLPKLDGQLQDVSFPTLGDVWVVQLFRSAWALISVIACASPADAQEERWQVGQHPDYHVAMVKQVDDVFVAIYVSREPSIYMSPVLMETVLAPCGETGAVSLHGTEAIMTFGPTAKDRSKEVRDALDQFFERGQSTCDLASNLEERFFNRFEDAYAATDAILVAVGIFPLANPFGETDEELREPDQP